MCDVRCAMRTNPGTICMGTGNRTGICEGWGIMVLLYGLAWAVSSGRAICDEVLLSGILSSLSIPKINIQNSPRLKQAPNAFMRRTPVDRVETRIEHFDRYSRRWTSDPTITSSIPICELNSISFDAGADPTKVGEKAFAIPNGHGFVIFLAI